MQSVLLRLGVLIVFMTLLLGIMYMAVQNRGGGSEVILYDQYNNANYSGAPANSGEGQPADDFIVPYDQIWVVKQVEVAGIYFFGGPGKGKAQSINIEFFADENALPGAQITAQNSISYTLAAPDSVEVQAIPGAATPIRDYDRTKASFLAQISPITLSPGTYWLSVQANILDSSGGLHWLWVDRLVTDNHPAAFLGQYISSCASWGRLADCRIPGPYAEGIHGQVDMVFRLRGTLLPASAPPTETTANHIPSATPTNTPTPSEPTDTPPPLPPPATSAPSRTSTAIVTATSAGTATTMPSPSAKSLPTSTATTEITVTPTMQHKGALTPPPAKQTEITATAIITDTATATQTLVPKSPPGKP